MMCVLFEMNKKLLWRLLKSGAIKLNYNHLRSLVRNVALDAGRHVRVRNRQNARTYYVPPVRMCGNVFVFVCSFFFYFYGRV